MTDDAPGRVNPPVRDRPVLTPGSFVPPDGETVRTFFAREVPAHTYYAYGKVALRDGLRRVVPDDGGNVLLPAYLPGGTVEPIRDLGLEPRFYRIEPSLAADVPDLQSRVDGDTVALVVAHYFGFPQPRLDAVCDVAADSGLVLVEDNAHSPFSRRDGQLLGTVGDFGFTSLRKVLPVPSGAVLLGLDEPAGPTSLAGPAPRLDASDARFLAGSLLRYVSDGVPSVETLLGTLESLGAGPADPVYDPATLYRQAKVPLSRLAWYLTGIVDPEAVVASRRGVYRAWLDLFDRVGGPTARHDALPTGVCPQVVPLAFDDPDEAGRFVDALAERRVKAIHTWPVMAPEVTEAEYPTATAVAERTVLLPCHQSLSPSTVSGLDPVVEDALDAAGVPSD